MQINTIASNLKDKIDVSSSDPEGDQFTNKHENGGISNPALDISQVMYYMSLAGNSGKVTFLVFMRKQHISFFLQLLQKREKNLKQKTLHKLYIFCQIFQCY